MKANMTNDVKIDILEHVDESGTTYYIERFERLLPLSEIDHENSTA